jgi:3-oxoacyl-[acyl-carrier-protein] synthase-3
MYVPPNEITNDAFVKMGLDTSDDWITSRTGIKSRRLVGRNEATSDLAVEAARRALHVADVHAHDVDFIIVATCTPDQIMPATASLVQDRLGAGSAGAMDLNAACSGFVYALITGAAFIESERARNVLVIGADELSVYLDWKDRSTCILFGDGAGAVLLRPGPEPGLLASTTGSDGSGANLLHIRGGARLRLAANGRNGAGPAAGGDQHYLRMNGPAIFRWATQKMAVSAEEVMRAAGLTPEQVDLFLPHQANVRIIEAAAKRLGLSDDRVFCNVGRYGNTSAASIPIALCEAIAAGRVQPGRNLVLASFGAGLTWAAVALRWTADVRAVPSPWTPFVQRFETQVAAVRSALRRQERRLRATIDRGLKRE